MKCQVYKLEEEKPISPRAFAHLVSSTLYEKRYYFFILDLSFLFLLDSDHSLLSLLSLVLTRRRENHIFVQWI